MVLRNTLLAATSLPLLAACTGGMATTEMVRHHPKEAAVISGPPVRSSITPFDGALECLGQRLAAARKSPLGIAIGDIRDYTGKQSQDEGAAVTQGGALMAYSALGKLGKSVRLHERFDTRIAEAELAYIDRRQLGDGAKHRVDSADGGETTVPWKPYYGGTIRQSDYFIVGGITELNYNIQSGGGEFAVSGIGPKRRVYTMNVALDLRIVGSQSLLVYETVSLEKQLTGYEVGFGIFRFFGNQLFDVNIGAKNQEPLQLGVRTAIEAGVFDLVSSVAKVDAGDCIPQGLQHLRARLAALNSATTTAYVVPGAVAPADASPAREAAPHMVSEAGTAAPDGLRQFHRSHEHPQPSPSLAANGHKGDVATAMPDRPGGQPAFG